MSSPLLLKQKSSIPKTQVSGKSPGFSWQGAKFLNKGARLLIHKSLRFVTIGHRLDLFLDKELAPPGKWVVPPAPSDPTPAKDVQLFSMRVLIEIAENLHQHVFIKFSLPIEFEHCVFDGNYKILHVIKLCTLYWEI